MKTTTILLLFLSTFSAHSQTQKEVSREWTSFNQTIDVQTATPKKFKVVAFVKVDTQDSNAWAGVWARVDRRDDERGFFDNMSDRHIKTNEWQSYTVEGKIDANSKSLSFGGLSMYNGKFYFDKFELYIENDKGILVSVQIPNSSFEMQSKNNEIPKWNLGIENNQMVKVKEYKITSEKDRKDGVASLLLEGSGIKFKETGKIGNIEGASPQIGAMISMLEDLKDRVEEAVKNMSQYEIDYLHDKEANRIGALVLHLAAAEAYYQVFTFENRDFNAEEKKKWEAALDLDEGGRDVFKGHDIQYYLSIYNEVRAKTIAELKKRDDAWFAKVQPRYDWTNQYCWFHVMEHQSSHLGQILFLKKRIPPQMEVDFEQKIKN
ncbi:DinB family protein [Flavobacterium sp. LB2R40]|uniref:DinB family protein n=1 Tax=Flavobacterium sp. LB2R40 TaxID=3401722 RepID=UPI003AAE2DA6